MTRLQLKRARKLLHQAFQDPEIALQWGQCCDAIQAYWDLGPKHPEYADECWKFACSLGIDLLVMIEERAPELYLSYGQYLPGFLVAAAFYARTGTISAWSPHRIEHLPDNPIGIRPNGDFYAPDWLVVPPDHHIEIREYFRSLKPPGRPGRPKQTMPAKPTRRLDPNLALYVHHLASDGLNWKDIARLVYPDLTAAERSQRRKEQLGWERLTPKGLVNLLNPLGLISRSTKQAGRVIKTYHLMTEELADLGARYLSRASDEGETTC